MPVSFSDEPPAQRGRSASAVVFGLSETQFLEADGTETRTQKEARVTKLQFNLAPIAEATEEERADSTQFMADVGTITKEPGYAGPARSALKRRSATPSWALLQAANKLKLFNTAKKAEEPAPEPEEAPKRHKIGSGLPSDKEEDCTIEFVNGTVYRGQGITYLVYLHPHGSGSLSWQSKQWGCAVKFVPRDGWEFGCCSGHGTISLTDGSVYTGEVRGDGASSPQLSLNLEKEAPEPSKAELHADGQGTMAYGNGDEYVGQWEGSMRQGQGRQVYKSTGDIYVGEWIDDKFHGNGNYRNLRNEWTLVGIWMDGQPQTGTKTWVNGNEYVGYWKDSMRHGTGKMVFVQGTRREGFKAYDGHWGQDMLHGKGTMQWHNGDRFVGYWDCDCIKDESKGVMDYADGGRYDGEWKGQLRHGHGRIVYPSGLVFSGQWKHGRRAAGVAKVQYTNGDFYRGELLAEHLTTPDAAGRPGTLDGSGSDTVIREGEGRLEISGRELCPAGRRSHEYLAAEACACTVSCTMRATVGDHCQGTWRADLPVMAERFYQASGDRYYGSWKDGLPAGDGVLTYANKDVFEGKWVNGARAAGYGRMQYNNGDIYEGSWNENAKQDGEGKILYGHSMNTRGDVFNGLWSNGYPRKGIAVVSLNAGHYDGAWEDGKPHGKGEMVFSDGGTFTGDWVRGRRHGYGRLQNGAWRWYEGGWKHDLYDGAGTITDLRSMINYVGEFKAGKRHGEGVETYGYGLDPEMLSTSTFEGKFANNMKSQGVFTHSDTTQWDRVYDAEGDLVHNRLKGERLTLKAAAKMALRGGRVFLSGAADRPSKLELCDNTSMVADDSGKPIRTPSILPILSVSSPRVQGSSGVQALQSLARSKMGAAPVEQAIGSARKARYGLAGMASDMLRTPRPPANAAGESIIDRSSLSRVDLYL